MANGSVPLPSKWIAAPTGIHRIYANYAHVSWTLHDVTVRVGQLIPADLEHPSEPGSVIEERADITFTWPHAKAVRDMLNGIIAAYENANGEINTSVVLAPQPQVPQEPAK